MENRLLMVSEETLTRLSLPRINPNERGDPLESVSFITHGDRDVSGYEGFDLLVAGHGADDSQSIRLPRYVALLRRRRDGALRMIRHWASASHMNGDMMVSQLDVETVHDAYSTHDKPTRDMVVDLVETGDTTDVTPADMRAHDEAVLRELAWHARRASRHAMDPNLAKTLANTAADLTPVAGEQLSPPASRPSWHDDWPVEYWYAGYPTTLGKHQAVNAHHLKDLAARLDEAGDNEAASTLRWLGWHRDLDVDRSRLLADEAVEVLRRRIELLEAALSSIGALESATHHWMDSTMRQNPTECLSHHVVGEMVREALKQSKDMTAAYEAQAGRSAEEATALLADQ